MQQYILTFDVGTSSCKAALFSMEGGLIATGRGSYGINRLPGGRVEQDPAELLAGIRTALAQLRGQGYDLGEIQAVSFSSQIAAHCFVDEHDRPITPILSWMDQRSAAQVDAYNAAFTQTDTARLTGMDMLITPAHTITKLRWFSDCAPEVLARAKHIVQVKELIIHALTGEWVTDPTSLKGVVNQQNGDPIPEIMEFTRCSDRLLPRVGMPYQEAGRVLPGVEGFEDIRPGTPVVIGWNDMNAACLGMCGLPEDQIGFDLTGTSEHLGVMMNDIPDGFICRGVNRVPFLQGREICYGVTSSGGQAFDWYVQKVFAQGDVQNAYADLLERLGRVKRSEVEKLIFLPYLEGERNPWNAPGGRGVFFGLNGNHDKYHMAYAVMEGVCFALRTIYERMPARPEGLVVAGGAARNDIWNRMKADCLGSECRRLHTTEAGCNGAAILAMNHLRSDTALGEIARGMTGTIRSWMPDPGVTDYYNEKFSRFMRLHEHLKTEFERN